MSESVIDTDLLSDALIDVADEIRRAIHGSLGTHPFKITQVTRRWAGGRLGLGGYQDTIFVPDPQPTVKKGSQFRHGPGGFEKRFDLVLTGISLRYTEQELAPKGSQDTEVVWILEEASGTRQAPEFYTVVNLTPRRGDSPGDDIDWRMELKTVSALTPFDGTDG